MEISSTSLIRCYRVIQLSCWIMVSFYSQMLKVMYLKLILSKKVCIDVFCVKILSNLVKKFGFNMDLKLKHSFQDWAHFLIPGILQVNITILSWIIWAINPKKGLNQWQHQRSFINLSVYLLFKINLVSMA